MRMRPTIVGALFALAAVAAHAERDPLTGAPLPPGHKRDTPSPITDRFSIRGTFFDPSFNTTLRVDSKTNGTMGTPVSAENDLGMPARRPQGRMELMFRLRKRNKLRVDYFETSRSGTQVLARQIAFGDETFNAGDLATSSLDWRSFNLTYTYSVIRTDRLEIGTGLGLHLLEAQAQGAVPARQLQQDVSGAGAFPTIPLELIWRISRRFALTARGQYFHIAHNGSAGSLGDYHADVQYRWAPNFAIGAGYSELRYMLEVNDASFPGSFRMNVRGPEAFVRVSF
ncbi:MAG TPA: hypothetical protein VFB37_09770 [Steroidobacteraceae bacterium]|nr:hypothetical protein [Steroidobacteraceae bacterium]